MLGDKNILVYVLLSCLAIGSWWLVKLSEPELVEVQEVIGHTVDYYSYGYQKQSMNEQGQLASEVKAAKMLHYKDDESVNLEAPVLSFFNSQRPPWIIQAEFSLLTNKGKDLLLKGQVIADRAAASGSRAVTIKTSDLNVKPEINYAETTNLAELQSPPNITTGTGMQLYFIDPIKITLLSQVRGKYEIQ
jgi:lipopolysaccharide export system protein LptC